MNPGDVLDLAHGRAVAVEVVDPDGAAWAELHPDERARAAALAGVVLAADDRGAPTVPAGAVGSLSHKRELAVALVAPAAGWTIGVDLEVDRSRGIDIARKVLTAAELAALDAHGAAGAARDRAVILAFAIKEAVYKAIDPHLRRYVGFQEVAVWPDADGAVRVEPLADWGLDVEAAWRGLGSHLVCTARARPR